MPDIWFTADFHFGHNSIIRYCDLPSRSAEDMGQTILERLNASVRANDALYFLGDFCIGSKAWALKPRKQIRCKKILAVSGNHDKEAKLTEEFSWLNNLGEIFIRGQPIVLCHYAMRVWNRSHHGAWHLYGHSHGRLPELPTSLSMDVGVDTHGFRPWHYDEINALMAKEGSAQNELEMSGPSVRLIPYSCEPGSQTG